jgi:hypothetical protein
VKEENVLTLKLTLFYFTWIKTVTGALRQRRTTGGSVRVEFECEGRKCPHTQTHTHTFLFYMNKDGHRIIAPEAHHEGQCEGVDWVWRKKMSSHSNSNSHFFILYIPKHFRNKQQVNPIFRGYCWCRFFSTVAFCRHYFRDGNECRAVVIGYPWLL